MIHLFLDANVLPRQPDNPGQYIDQLIELVNAKTITIHMSDVAMREWRSQMVEQFRLLVKEMWRLLIR